MEIPEINMITDFEAGMKCLQNPSFISRFFSFSGIEKVPHVYSFWKWGALIFALYATFSSIIKRIKLFFICFHTVELSLHQNEEVEISEDDEISFISSDDDDDEEEEEGGGAGREGEGEGEDKNSPTTLFQGQKGIDEDFCVKGLNKRWQNGHLQRHWWEFTSGKNVVKLWDSLGLNITEDFINHDSKSVISIWDFDQDRENYNFSGHFSNIPAASVASQAVFLTAEANGKEDKVVLGGYDTRMRRRVPALYAEWRSPVEKIADVAIGRVNNKVYVRDNFNGVLTVGDVRNLRMPLMNMTV